MVNFTNEEFLSLKGKRDEARIMTYNLKKGYGFARTASGREIFISSYQVINRKEERKLVFGAKIAFTYGIYAERLCATEVEVLEKFPSEMHVKIETATKSFEFNVETILKLGVSQLLQNKKYLAELETDENLPSNYLENGYSEKDFKCLFIETKDGKIYRFFDFDSKLNGCGQIDVSKTYTEIYKNFFV